MLPQELLLHIIEFSAIDIKTVLSLSTVSIDFYTALAVTDKGTKFSKRTVTKIHTELSMKVWKGLVMRRWPQFSKLQ
jgi:hypothetical protein